MNGTPADDIDAIVHAPGHVLRVGGLQRSVADLRRSIDFYCGALGFHVVGPGAGPASTRARLMLGDEQIELVQVAAAALRPPAFAPDARFQHAAIVTAEMDAAWQRLHAYAPIAISDGGVAQRLPAATGGISAFKFRDPDGHPLELIQFPAGPGNPRRHIDRGAAPTLGIDHFALVVADVERSIAFFASWGFRVAARQVQSGVEQGRLDGLAEAVVEVVALRPASPTPHLELLGYRVPRAAVDPSSRAQPEAPGRDVIRLEAVDLGAEVRIADPDGHAFLVSGRSRHAVEN